MSNELNGKRVAILATDGFEQSELESPRKALEQAGAAVDIVAPQGPNIKGWKDGNWGQPVGVSTLLENANAGDYDGLVLPGGVMNPDKLRRDEHALSFIRAFFENGKPVAAICHGPWSLIDAGVVRGRRMTSYASIQADLKNAGAEWVDEEVVVDNGLVTSRHPGDLDAFNCKIVEEITEGKHAAQHA